MTPDERIKKLREEANKLRLAEAASQPKGTFLSGLKKGFVNQAKGLLSTSGKLEGLIKEYTGALMNPNINWEKIVQEEQSQNPLYQWSERKEKIGQGERLGEITSEIAGFAVPGTAITKGARVINKAQEAGKIGKGIAGLYKRLLTGAGEGAITYTQEGGDTDKGILSAIVGTVMPAGGKVSQYITSSPLEQAKNQIVKAIRPSVREKGIIGKVDKAAKTMAAYAVQSGRKLPESLDEALGLLQDTKKEIWRRIDKSIKSKKDIQIDTNDILNGVRDIVNEPGFNINPFAKRELQSTLPLLKSLYERKTISVPEAETIKEFINQTVNYNRQELGPIRERILKALGHDIKKKLDAILSNEIKGGKGEFQKLKDAYGALTATQKDLTKRIVVDARRNPVSLYDALGSVGGMDDIAFGLSQALTGNPVGAVSGLTAGTMQALIGKGLSKLNSPDELIRKGFGTLADEYKKYISGINTNKAKQYIEPAYRALIQKYLTKD